MAEPEALALGPVVIDVGGAALTTEDRARLLHPLTGGVILFARNYRSPEQLRSLTAEIHALREPPLLVCVDHEGGRVQRFRSGFTALPPLRALGRAWDRDRERARGLARELGYVLAAELRAHGVDLSFTPVLDIDHGNSSVIGDRALHDTAQGVCELGAALVQGLKEAGMGAVGKHFPGHGHVRGDSHYELPVDERPYADIERADLVPFKRLIEAGLPAIMPAHVIYPQVDSQPAGFSGVWLKRILREALGFDGLVFSDDLSMQGARVAGGIVARAQAAFDAGCDMVLVCNEASAVDELYAACSAPIAHERARRLARVHRRGPAKPGAALDADPRYVAARTALAELGAARPA